MMIMMKEIQSWLHDVAFGSLFSTWICLIILFAGPFVLYEVASRVSRFRIRYLWLQRAMDAEIEQLPKDLEMFTDPQYEPQIYRQLNRLRKHNKMTIEEMLTSKHGVIRRLGKQLCSKQLKDG